jgi:hypothetical protein
MFFILINISNFIFSPYKKFQQVLVPQIFSVMIFYLSILEKQDLVSHSKFVYIIQNFNLFSVVMFSTLYEYLFQKFNFF